MICVREIENKLKNNHSEKTQVFPLVEVLDREEVQPVLLFDCIRKAHSRCFFYESNEDSGSLGRYTFMGMNPIETIRVRQNRVIFEDSDCSQESDQPFQVIQNYIDGFHMESIDGLPPLSAGLVGFVGHECIYAMQELERFDKPGYDFLDDALLMLFKNIIVFDRLKDQIILVSNIIIDNKDQIDGEYGGALNSLQDLKELIKSSRKQSLSPFPEGIHRDELRVSGVLERSQFRSRFSKIKGHIRRGNLFQCVLSNRFEGQLDQDPLLVYRILRHTSPVPYLYYIQFDDVVLMGASPERFVQVQDGMVETRPIAGTRPRGKNRGEDLRLEAELITDEKEKAEHLMLVDLGRNDIGKVSVPGTVKVTQFMQVERFSNVMHLVSKVAGKLRKDIKPLEAFCSCFVAGTLSGAPKRKAIEILQELEPVERGPYGGAILYYDFRGNFDSCITIRSLLVHQKKVFFQAGAGIVADSQEESEYNEIIAKTGAITRSLRKALGGATL